MSKYLYNIKPLGESGIIVTFGSEINPQIHKKVKSLADYIEGHPFNGFCEYVISYTSVAVFYNPFIIKADYKHINTAAENKTVFKLIKGILENYISAADKLPSSTTMTVEIPVCYGGEYGPDIDYVAKHNNLSIDDIIAIHSQPDYLVYMIGFCPGFPYLGGMDERIAAPRKSEPRLSIPAGSIGIAGRQTGCYPISTPGGWQIIGRTPLNLFHADRPNPSLLNAGDSVKFIPISPEKFQEIKVMNT
ncbi:5-oxoprolinase subunit PxpB [Pectinatus sottacetonis]|uniref:5-oxoprolinase subunit PxpB n=1 Tax=Pectinatus sottacetonis TaxID=1002795 RepID=UPI0018C7ABA8|nr:5-oxoprolinase subunit PxpB [Pectinatus sottacetonis]